MIRSIARKLVVAAALSAGMAAAAQAGPPAPEVASPAATAVSPALRDLPNAPTTQAPSELKVVPRPRPLPPRPAGAGRPPSRNSAVPRSAVIGGPAAASTTSFAGVAANGFVPGDPNIAVGPQHIVQMVNSEIAVFDKAGNLVTPAKRLNTIWAGLPGPCAQSNAGDPIVQYDKLADRWLLSQLGSTSGPYFWECIAVSTSGDPSGAYHLYQYFFGKFLNDYPKFGVWPTATNGAYLASYNLFFGNTAVGSRLCAYNRAAMLAGAAAKSICFTVRNDSGYLPSDLDGSTAPDDGSPGYFVNFNTLSSLRLYKLKPDFASPSNSTLTLASPDIAVTPFSMACGGDLSCIPQPMTQEVLDSLGDRLMYRLGYRKFADHEAMVVNHSITAGPVVGVRWYELRATTPGAFSLFQQGTFTPADGTSAWMGSAAMNGAGQIGLGFSISSGSTFPGVAATGRCATAAAGQMGPEIVLQPGSGSQTGFTRWGDYSALRVDPSDDTTFWYTNEYYPQTSPMRWSTAIGAFTLSCP